MKLLFMEPFKKSTMYTYLFMVSPTAVAKELKQTQWREQAKYS